MLKDNVLEEYDYVFAIMVKLLFIAGIASRFIFNDFFVLLGTDFFKVFFTLIFLVVAFNKLSSDFDDEAKYKKVPSNARKISDFHFPVLFLCFIESLNCSFFCWCISFNYHNNQNMRDKNAAMFNGKKINSLYTNKSLKPTANASVE